MRRISAGGRTVEICRQGGAGPEMEVRTGLPDELAGTMAGYPAGSSGAPSRHRPLVTAHQNGQHKPQGRRIWEKGKLITHPALRGPTHSTGRW